MATQAFDDISAELKEAVRKQLEREIQMVTRLQGSQRKGHREPVSDAQRAAYQDFGKRYNAIMAEGWETGFLIGGYEPDELDEPRGTWVWDETEKEFQQRLKREECTIGNGGHIVFPVSKGPRP